MTTLKDIMTTDLTTVSSGVTLREVAQKMKDGDIGNVLLMEGGALAGIITDRDIVVRGVAEGYDLNSPASSVATQDVFTLPCSTTVEDAARAMGDRQLRRLPVTDSASGEVAGIVSLGDLSVRTDGDADQQALEGISQPD